MAAGLVLGFWFMGQYDWIIIHQPMTPGHKAAIYYKPKTNSIGMMKINDRNNA